MVMKSKDKCYDWNSGKGKDMLKGYRGQRKKWDRSVYDNDKKFGGSLYT